MEVSIIGFADKRAVVYPLLYAASVLGKTAFITDDTSFRRLSRNGNERCFIGNVDIIVTSDFSIVDLDEYQNVLTAPFRRADDLELQNKIYTKQDASPFHFASKKQKITDAAVVHIGYEKPQNLKEKFIPLSENLLRYLHYVENMSCFEPPKDKALIKTLTELFSPIIGKSLKETAKLLTYKGGAAK